MDVKFLYVKPDGTLRYSVGRGVVHFYSPKPIVVSSRFSCHVTTNLFKFWALWHVALCILVPSFLLGVKFRTSAASIDTAVRISNLKWFTLFPTFFLYFLNSPLHFPSKSTFSFVFFGLLLAYLSLVSLHRFMHFLTIYSSLRSLASPTDPIACNNESFLIYANWQQILQPRLSLPLCMRELYVTAVRNQNNSWYFWTNHKKDREIVGDRY